MSHSPSFDELRHLPRALLPCHFPFPLHSCGRGLPPRRRRGHQGSAGCERWYPYSLAHRITHTSPTHANRHSRYARSILFTSPPAIDAMYHFSHVCAPLNVHPPPIYELRQLPYARPSLPTLPLSSPPSLLSTAFSTSHMLPPTIDDICRLRPDCTLPMSPTPAIAVLRHLPHVRPLLPTLTSVPLHRGIRPVTSCWGDAGLLAGPCTREGGGFLVLPLSSKEVRGVFRRGASAPPPPLIIYLRPPVAPPHSLWDRFRLYPFFWS